MVTISLSTGLSMVTLTLMIGIHETTMRWLHQGLASAVLPDAYNLTTSMFFFSKAYVKGFASEEISIEV